MRLSSATMQALPTSVARPDYDRDRRGVGIVHFGIGAFHRAHMAAYTDAAMAAVEGDWRILGVSSDRSTMKRPAPMPAPPVFRSTSGIQSLALPDCLWMSLRIKVPSTVQMGQRRDAAGAASQIFRDCERRANEEHRSCRSLRWLRRSW